MDTCGWHYNGRGGRGQAVVAGCLSGGGDMVPVLQIRENAHGVVKGVAGMHGSCMCWDRVWSQSKVSGIHRAAKSSILLVIMCTMMGQVHQVE